MEYSVEFFIAEQDIRNCDELCIRNGELIPKSERVQAFLELYNKVVPEITKDDPEYHRLAQMEYEVDEDDDELFEGYEYPDDEDENY